MSIVWEGRGELVGVGGEGRASGCGGWGERGELAFVKGKKKQPIPYDILVFALYFWTNENAGE